MSFGIVAFTLDDEHLHRHLSLYRLLPQLASGEDGTSNLITHEELVDKLREQGYRYSVVLENDRNAKTRVETASMHFRELGGVDHWTGAIIGNKANFFFQNDADALSFQMVTMV